MSATRDGFGGFAEFLEACRRESLLVEPLACVVLPLRGVRLDPEDWGAFARVAAGAGLRWCAVWGDHRDERIEVNACFAYQSGYLLARTAVPVSTPVLPSHVPHFPAADRPERHLQDLLGVAFTDHPDTRRWVRHRAWDEHEFPLRSDFAPRAAVSVVTPADAGYPFLQAAGTGVYEIPVGPIHAGIIEPGHFRFQAVGEAIWNLEVRLGYTHKGIEKLAEGRDAYGLAQLAGRVSGDSTVAHTWAACMAMERAAGCDVPARALAVRALLAERERIANHLGDVGAICNDVGFTFAWYQFSRLREVWQRDHARVFGHRLLRGTVIPGGTAVDVSTSEAGELAQAAAALIRELDELVPILQENASLQDRLAGTGVLTAEAATRLGVLGCVARASGIDRDVRRDAPYAPYERLAVRVPIRLDGDVAARVAVRLEEIRAALELHGELLETLPGGSTRLPWAGVPEGAEGVGIVEGWRGETLAFVRFGAGGTVRRYYPRDPSWLNWPALETLISGNIVPDFPVCNKSVNGSYSGHDL